MTKAEPVDLHPAVDAARTSDATPHGPVMLSCHCATHSVEVTLDSSVFHNHLCGCSKCWKPDGALFAQTAVVPRDALNITANGDKLEVVDETQAIVRHACRACGTHVYGRVENRDHHFYGIDFVRPELAAAPQPVPEFAGFVSSIIECGASPSKMEAVRATLSRKGIPFYDAFSPELMDIIAWHKVKIGKISRS